MDPAKNRANPTSESQSQRLRERVRKLASEKAYLELVNRLMARLSELPGLEALIDNMLLGISDTIGGTNVALYYWIDGALHYADVYGERSQPAAIADPLVQQAIDTRKPVEEARDLAHSQMLNSVLSSAWTWVFPLLAGEELVGVLKLENLHVGTHEMQTYLPNFFAYAAAVLKNGILGHARLKQAYDELKAANASLALARDAAEAANRAKSAFLANMSHELRTPLNAILGFAQLLARDPGLNETQLRNLDAVERSGQHLLELINDILELSRIEAGRLTLRKVEFDLGMLIATVAEMTQVRAQAKGLELGLCLEPGLPSRVEGDSYHLRQVLLNLLGNAVKYTRQGRVTLKVAWDGERAGFAVEDTGQGIAPEDRDKVFDPFYQTAVGVAQGEGAGLGLAIARDCVRLMGGELALDSAPGQGSRFHFSIPLRVAEPAVAEDQAPPEILGLAPGEPNWRVLVVDDDANGRSLMAQLLRQAGFEVHEAVNGVEAVRLFGVWHPHFIWMDVHMPELDGVEATRQIRALPGGAPVQIVALTATAFDEQRAQVLNAGCDGFLRKPFQVAEIFEILGQRLGLRYRYAETDSAAQGVGQPEPDAAALNVLAPELRAALRQAADALDSQAARALVARLEPEHPALARSLRKIVDGYRFDQLAEWMEGG
jgi:signal transduction histidine kinase/DNA-binding response OmpR family regulator